MRTAFSAQWQRKGGAGNPYRGILFKDPNGVPFGVAKLSNGMRSVPLVEEHEAGLVTHGVQIEVSDEFAAIALTMFVLDQEFQSWIPTFNTLCASTTVSRWQRKGGSGNRNEGLLLRNSEGVLFGVTVLPNGMRAVPLMDEEEAGLVEHGPEIEMPDEFVNCARFYFRLDRKFQSYTREFDAHVK